MLFLGDERVMYMRDWTRDVRIMGYRAEGWLRKGVGMPLPYFTSCGAETLALLDMMNFSER
jgi:hypothetical protein